MPPEPNNCIKPLRQPRAASRLRPKRLLQPRALICSSGTPSSNSGQVIAHAGVKDMHILGDQTDTLAHRPNPHNGRRSTPPSRTACSRADRRSAGEAASASSCRCRCAPPRQAHGPASRNEISRSTMLSVVSCPLSLLVLGSRLSGHFVPCSLFFVLRWARSRVSALWPSCSLFSVLCSLFCGVGGRSQTRRRPAPRPAGLAAARRRDRLRGAAPCSATPRSGQCWRRPAAGPLHLVAGSARSARAASRYIEDQIR